ncbi:MAG: ABC-2 transporter permease [Syntrophomonadaceae bacterium]|jgi:ABC-2 type transport system permease protein|nr:ABC-2 transporter permease [Syntrophomonadaceae bacterium]
MLQLIKKELILQKKMFIFGLCYSIFLFIVFADPVFRNFTYSMAAFGISYITIVGIAQAEYKNNSDIIINSLPITRREIVAAKYLSIVTCTIIALLFVAVVGLPFSLMPRPFDYRLINGSDVIITVISVFVLASLSLPICFKTGAQWIRVVNVVIFLLIFFAPVQIAEYMVNNPQTPWIRILIDMAGSQTWQLMLMGSVILLIILFISYYISLRIYINKDF